MLFEIKELLESFTRQRENLTNTERTLTMTNVYIATRWLIEHKIIHEKGINF